LLDFYRRGEQQERAVLVDDDGVGLLGDGVFAGVLEADADRHPSAVTLAAPAILREQIVGGHDRHNYNVARVGAIAKNSKGRCALAGIAETVTRGARMPVGRGPGVARRGGRVDEFPAFAVAANSGRF